MLVLTRKLGEAIVIDGVIRVEVLEVKGAQVRLGISAPREHQIYRHEIYAQIQAENLAANQLISGAIDPATLVAALPTLVQADGAT